MTSVVAIEGLMQPDTAFWVLSSIAQSSAALAGLTALLLVFVLSEARRETKVPLEVGIHDLLRNVFFAPLWLATITFLGAVLISLFTIGLVVPGGAPITQEVETMVSFSMLLLGAGIIALVLFVVNPLRWFESPETREARRAARKRDK